MSKVYLRSTNGQTISFTAGTQIGPTPVQIDTANLDYNPALQNANIEQLDNATALQLIRLSQITQQSQLVGSNVLIENPYGTGVGQAVDSLSENFWARAARVGRTWNYIGDKLAFGITSSWLWNWSQSVDPGMRLYPKSVIISADVTCQLGVKIFGYPGYQGGQNGTVYQRAAFVTASTPLILTFDGEIYIEDGNTQNAIYIGVNNAAAAGNICFAVQGVEVGINA